MLCPFRAVPMPIKAVPFDIDGTLVDFNDQHGSAWEPVFHGGGRMFEPHAIHDQIGKSADMLVPRLVPDTDEDAGQRLGDAHCGIFKAKFLENVRPFPVAPERLAWVHQAGQKVAFASSASRAELGHYLGLLDPRDIVPPPRAPTMSKTPSLRRTSSRTRAASTMAADPNT